ncbi:hypothetical protein [Allorhizobium undicola]|uniref:hypothetical protein n=1 Tax=Allorhizobium undicola TaxID=78527 RepID=UPI000AE69B8D|nr:hypothetical protein [Allorhizobium undicola]
MSGCVTDSAARAEIAHAAAARAVAQASTNLPERPAICREHFTRPALPRADDLARHREDQWQAAADAADRRVDFCGNFYDQVRAAYGPPPLNEEQGQ